MSLLAGVFLTGLASLIFLAAYIASRATPDAWWVSEPTVGVLTLPLILMMLGFGALSIGGALINIHAGGRWLADLLEAIALGAGYAFLGRFMLRRWRANSEKASAEVVLLDLHRNPPAAADQSPPPRSEGPRLAA